MKKMKLAVVFAALVSAFTFSSCLNGGDSSAYPDYQVVVTVTGDETFGYRLYADNGSILIPTSQSAAQLPGLKKVKRAIVAFDLTADQQVTQLEPGKSYNVVLDAQYCAEVPTSVVIDTYNNAPADTLMENNDAISEFTGLYAVKGYANVSITLPYDPSKRFYMNAGYDSEKDIDPVNNTLYLTIYYDHNSQNAYNKGRSMFSFRLPDSEYGSFSSDSINLVMRAKTSSSGNDLTEMKCRMAKKDLFAPSGY